MTAVRWLDQDEARAWRNYVELIGELSSSLEDDLVRASGLTLGDYQVLVNLSEAPDHRLRMCDLAVLLQLSPSGLTRRLDGLVRSGLVARVASSDDRRVSLAALTDAGHKALRAAAPGHVASVRKHMLDHMTREQIVALGDALVAIRSGRARADG